MRNKIINITIALASLALTFFVLEIAVRIYLNAGFDFKNFLEEKRTLLQSAYPAEFDTDLGWIPEKGDHRENVWGTAVTILENGIRSNGNNEYSDSDNSRPILAVGDSFTFGDQVSNSETWPAQLEKMNNSPVLNGGVFGYGIDQIFLRMELLASTYRPEMIIFSFIPNDIGRNELSERSGVPKPFFELSEAGDFTLINDHIIASPSLPLDKVRKLLGYSLLVHKMLEKSIPRLWLQGGLESTNIHSEGEQVTCRIFSELERFSKRTNIEILILVQYPGFDFNENIKLVNNVIGCIDQDILRLLDMRYALAELKNHDIAKYQNLFYGPLEGGHMTKEGNFYVASMLHEIISKQYEKEN